MDNQKQAGNLYLDIDKGRLLKELPSFFQSFSEVLSELVQNSYRANASRVDITLDLPNRTLTITDDGSGAIDPSTLITAGKTGWNEDRVVDPAGLGFFALLGVADEVTVETRAEGHHGWEIFITKDCFNGKAVSYMPLKYNEGPHPRGMNIHAKINEKADIAIHHRTYNWHDFRHLFPIDVSLTIKTVKEEDTQYHSFPAPSITGPSISIPEGTLYRIQDHNPLYRCISDVYHGISVGLVWEYRKLSSSISNDLGKQLPSEVAKALGTSRYLFVVNPESGVRPKLPDRREVIRDKAYLSMVEALAKKVIEATDVPNLKHQAEVYGIPPIVRSIHDISDKLDKIVVPDFLVATATTKLGLCGYRKCSYIELTQCYVGGTSEDYQVDRTYIDTYAKDYLVVKYEGTAEALNRLGIPAVCNDNGLEVAFVIDGAKYTDFHNCAIGSCESISVIVGGQLLRKIDQLVSVGIETLIIDGVEVNACPYFFTKSPKEFLDFINKDGDDRVEFSSWAVLALDEEGNLYDYIVDDVDSDYPGCVTEDRSALLNDLVATYVEKAFPDRTKDYQRWAALSALDDRLWKTVSGIDIGIQELEWFLNNYPEVEEAKNLLDRLRAVGRIRFPLTQWNPGDKEDAELPS